MYNNIDLVAVAVVAVVRIAVVVVIAAVVVVIAAVVSKHLSIQLV